MLYQAIITMENSMNGNSSSPDYPVLIELREMLKLAKHIEYLSQSKEPNTCDDSKTKLA